MTQKEAAELLPFITAYAKKEPVYVRKKGSKANWELIEEDDYSLDWFDRSDIEYSEFSLTGQDPEPTYRPFVPTDVHLPLCIRKKVFSEYSWIWQVMTVRHDGIQILEQTCCKVISWGELYCYYECSLDGGKTWLPCGVKQ